MNYCESPTELFNLLFHNGVGTLRAEFYLAWTDHIRHLSEDGAGASLILQRRRKWARLAGILAHGLRARAQPLHLLEDRAESVFIGFWGFKAGVREAGRRRFHLITLVGFLQ